MTENLFRQVHPWGTVDYRYRAEIIRVVDGDTVHAIVDLGFDIRMTMKLRLMGINAPELRTAEGPPARAWLLELIEQGLSLPAPAMIETVKDHTEKYGRYLATIFLPDGTNVNEAMISAGQAVRYVV